ncbi:TetR-like C-terminal domain-containing protein [[Actinomadura] parvosata]|uniref:TetR-like C-terminal domain-containing protein n=1 Tax=[Actinomadura] parvosata TaxID=1955412 RepID=UPI00406BF695
MRRSAPGRRRCGRPAGARRAIRARAGGRRARTGRRSPSVQSAHQRAAQVLVTSAGSLSPRPADDRLTTIAAWSLAHGFTSLWLNGALPESADGDPEALARSMIRLMFGALR